MTANDVSRGSFQMLRLRQTLAGAHLILTTRLLELSEQIRSLHEGYHFRLGNVESLQTVLGKLIAMSPEVSFTNHTLTPESSTFGRPYSNVLLSEKLTQVVDYSVRSTCLPLRSRSCLSVAKKPPH